MKYTVNTTKEFNQWFKELDKITSIRLTARFVRITNGNFGDYRAIEENLYELRFFFNGGIRVYFTIRQQQVVMLLTGGTKSSQSKDLEKAREILKELED